LKEAFDSVENNIKDSEQQADNSPDINPVNTMSDDTIQHTDEILPVATIVDHAYEHQGTQTDPWAN